MGSFTEPTRRRFGFRFSGLGFQGLGFEGSLLAGVEGEGIRGFGVLGLSGFSRGFRVLGHYGLWGSSTFRVLGDPPKPKPTSAQCTHQRRAFLTLGVRSKRTLNKTFKNLKP